MRGRPLLVTLLLDSVMSTNLIMCMTLFYDLLAPCCTCSAGPSLLFADWCPNNLSFRFGLAATGRARAMPLRSADSSITINHQHTTAAPLRPPFNDGKKNGTLTSLHNRGCMLLTCVIQATCVSACQLFDGMRTRSNVNWTRIS